MPNKLDIIKHLSESVAINSNKAKEVIDALCDYITDQLNENNSVNITGFGTFSKKSKKTKIKVGEESEVVDTATVDFKVGETLAKKIRQNGNI